MTQDTLNAWKVRFADGVREQKRLTLAVQAIQRQLLELEQHIEAGERALGAEPSCAGDGAGAVSAGAGDDRGTRASDQG